VSSRRDPDPLGSQLVALLERDAQQLAARFALRYKAIEAERPNVRRRYGVCYADGVIKIRLRHAVSRQPLKYSSLVNTLCHELAHLRHFDHGERFKAFYLRILEYARSAGIYRPGPAPQPGPARGLARSAMPVRARAAGRPSLRPVQLELGLGPPPASRPRPGARLRRPGS
jgi:hypothetical protein